MLFVTEYRFKPNMTKAESQRLMDEFGKRGASPGELAHYVRIDGSGGTTISDIDDIDAAFAGVLAYTEFMTFTVTPVMKIDDAVAPMLAYLES
jgi:Protein of unknown function (DUF3303)